MEGLVWDFKDFDISSTSERSLEQRSDVNRLILALVYRIDCREEWLGSKL